MPIYEYQCPDCGHPFELLQKFSDPPATDCPKCGAGNVKKLISQTSFVLKGGGWYNDHYGLKSGGDAKASEAKGAESKGSEAPSAGSGTPGEAAKPAPAPAAAPAAPAAPAAKPAASS